MKFKTFPIFLAFLVMGVADAMGPMAISGGAIVPLIMGELVDSGMLTFAYIVPAVCFAYLLMLSLKGKKKQLVYKI